MVEFCDDWNESIVSLRVVVVVVVVVFLKRQNILVSLETGCTLDFVLETDIRLLLLICHPSPESPPHHMYDSCT